ncbi:MAG TPA: recombinase family protein [Solirubrobacteraceae bacterium]|nr:recombinase family protein [Solirubrobacteraceae bacterium]
MPKKARDVVVVRVSEQGDREEENFHSPNAQLAKAQLWSEDRGNRVVDAFEEIDVSSKLALARRPGLVKAIGIVEAGEADHIVVAYFDRLVRSLKVQLEVIERVEPKGAVRCGSEMSCRRWRISSKDPSGRDVNRARSWTVPPASRVTP